MSATSARRSTPSWRSPCGPAADHPTELRAAIIELGKGLAQRARHSAAYEQQLLGRMMPPLKAAVAVGHQAHRLAFALMRAGHPYDPDRCAASSVTGTTPLLT